MPRITVRSQVLFPALVLCALLLFLVPEANINSLRGQSLSLLSPVLNVFHSAAPHRTPEPALIEVAAKPAVAAQPKAQDLNLLPIIDDQRAQIARLQDEIAKLRSSGPLDATLRLTAGFSAEVIGRQILWQEPILALNKGQAEGVRMHAGVMHRGAVLGRVISVGPHASCVALLTHRGLNIGARLSNCRVEGVLQGGALPTAGETEERLCRMAVVSKDLNAKVGEQVVTSGYDGVFPAGLWLGVVVAVNKKSDVQWELTVRPACNANAVETVQVLTASQLEVPWPVAKKTK
ncbi:MAG TPA: rod shape-determining protein MreC [Planctomycetota bacterium]|jgi:cell shape-determining protein MreC